MELVFELLESSHAKGSSSARPRNSANAAPVSGIEQRVLGYLERWALANSVRTDAMALDCAEEPPAPAKGARAAAAAARAADRCAERSFQTQAAAVWDDGDAARTHSLAWAVLQPPTESGDRLAVRAREALGAAVVLESESGAARAGLHHLVEPLWNDLALAEMLAADGGAAAAAAQLRRLRADAVLGRSPLLAANLAACALLERAGSAAAEVLRCVREHPGFLPLAAAAAVLLLLQRRSMDAERLLRRLLALQPCQPWLWVNLAVALAAAGRVDRAGRLLVALRSRFESARGMGAEIARAAVRENLARVEELRATSIVVRASPDPGPAAPLLRAAAVSFDFEKYREAADQFLAAAAACDCSSVDAARARAAAGIALCCKSALNSDDLAETDAHFEHARVTDAEHAAVYRINLALAARLRGQHARAVQLLDEVLALPGQPHRAVALSNKAVVLIGTGEYAAAQDILREAAALSPRVAAIESNRLRLEQQLQRH